MFKTIWKQIEYFITKSIDDHCTAYASQTAFFMILSFIPFMIVFSALLKYTPVTEMILTNGIRKVMPDYITPLILSVVKEVYGNNGKLISFTAIAAIWSAGKGVLFLSNGLNIIFECRETRNWLFLRLRSVFYMGIFIIAIVFMMILLVFENSLRDILVENSPIFKNIFINIHNFRLFFLLIFLIFVFAIIYKALPNNRPKFLEQLPGAVISALGWYAISSILSIYVKYFNGFSMYGSLTTIALVMLWLYFCVYIFLLSAEINSIYGKKFSQFIHKKG